MQTPIIKIRTEGGANESMQTPIIKIRTEGGANKK